jgi:dTDP-4-dehydrorhamnose reductase
MRILVIGGGGQVGSKIIQQAEDRFDVYATYQTRRPPMDESRIFKIDKTNREATFSVFETCQPEIAIDTAALHNVDYCETHKDQASAVNMEGTKNVAEACRKHGARMIFVSTDYVFDGEKGNYAEDENPNPVSHYGLTKLEAERMIGQTCSDYAIARPSVIYSYVPPAKEESSSGKPLNFAMWLIQKLVKKEPVKIVTDQYSSPTLADNLGETLLKLAESKVIGVYHAAGRTRLSRYELSLKIARKLKFDEKLVSSITTDQLKQLARRPRDSSLDVTKIERDLGLRMPTIDEALDQFSKQFAGVEHQ